MTTILAVAALWLLLLIPFFGCCCAPVPCATATISVLGCSSGPIIGCDVVITLDGVTILDGNTGETGTITTGTLISGTYNYTVTHPSGRVNSASGSFTITCPQSNVTIPVTLSPATGYHCYCGNVGTNSGLPVSDTWNASLSTGESFTMTYSSGTAQWIGTVDISWAGCVPGMPGGCAAQTIPLTITTPTGFASCGSNASCQISGAASPVTATPCGINMLSSGVGCPTFVSGVPSFTVTANIKGAVFGTCNAAPGDPAGQSDLTITE